MFGQHHQPIIYGGKGGLQRDKVVGGGANNNFGVPGIFQGWIISNLIKFNNLY